MCTRRMFVAAVALLTAFPIVGRAQEMEPYRREVLALSRRIDELIASRWKEAGIKPAPPAVDATFFRRLNLDLAGRIPALIDLRDYLDHHCFHDKEADVWKAEAPRLVGTAALPLSGFLNGSSLFAVKSQDMVNKRWEWTEKLLAQDTYSKHFASVLRSLVLQGSNSQQVQFFQLALENWLQDHLHKNTPYSRIVKDILTASPNNPNRFNPNDIRAASPVAFYIAGENKPENLAASATRMFLGVKLECAQCHAHPFAKWTKNQFWEFAAFFGGIQNQRGLPGEGGVSAQAVVLRGREITIPGTNKKVKAKFLDGADPVWTDGVDSRSILADWIIAKDNPFFAKAAVDHLWTYFFGISLFEPILEPSDDSPVTHPQLLDELAEAFIANNYDLKFIIRAIVHTEAYARSSEGRKEEVRPEDHYFFSRMPVRGLSPEQIYDSVVEAVQYKSGSATANPYQPQFPNRMTTPRAEFIAKYTSQEKRNEMQTSILQALFLMNGKFLNEQILRKNSQPLNTLTNADYPGGNVRRVDTIYVMILGRQPRPEEAERFVRYLDRRKAEGKLSEGMSDILWVLLNSGEFLLNH